MPTFEQIPTEYASTGFTGADYGSRVRILMRSESHVVFVALGVRIIPRGKRPGYHDTIEVCRVAKRGQLSEARSRERIVKYFGEGADEAAILAATTRGQGTILVDGGGPALPLPHAIARALSAADYESLTPYRDNLIPVDRHCLQCEKPLRPALDQHNFSSMPVEGQPRTLEEVQRLSNYPVMGLRGYASNHSREWWPIIQSFTTWDGESYEQDTFCSDSCAATYGRRAAQSLPHLPANGEPTRMARHKTNWTSHYDVEADEERRRLAIEESFARQRAASNASRK
jgi:hypothetical protein